MNSVCTISLHSATPPLAYVIFSLFGTFPTSSSSSFSVLLFFLFACAPAFVVVALVGVALSLSLADKGGWPDVGVGACEGVDEGDGDSSYWTQKNQHALPFQYLRHMGQRAPHTLMKLTELRLNTLSASVTCPFLLVLDPPPPFAFIVPVVEEPLM